MSEVDINAAREFVTNYVPDPEIIKSLPDDKLLEFHGKLNENLTGIRTSAIEEFKSAHTDLPGNWRESFAKAATGGDTQGDAFQKELKRLERFATPADVYPFGRNLEKKLSGGEYVRKLPQDADEKAMQEWRKEMGIPSKPDEYYSKLGDLQIGDTDKPIFDDFFENVALKQNLSPEVAKATVEWYHELQKTQQEVQADEDLRHTKEGEDYLRSDDGWGRDYRANLNAVENLKSRMPKDVKEMLENSRYPDGRAIFNDPKFMMFLAQMERQLNPASTFVPSGTTNDIQGVEQRIAEIQKVITTNRKAYNADPRMQDELSRLLAAQELMQQRQ
jgi:hypothetical protein